MSERDARLERVRELVEECKRHINSLNPNSVMNSELTIGRVQAYASIKRQLQKILAEPDSSNAAPQTFYDTKTSVGEMPANAAPCNCANLLRQKADEYEKTASQTNITEELEIIFRDEARDLRSSAEVLEKMASAAPAKQTPAAPQKSERLECGHPRHRNDDYCINRRCKNYVFLAGREAAAKQTPAVLDPKS